MTPLLEALQAAQKIGFDAPKCAQCWPCKSCDASGLDIFGGWCIRCDGTRRAHTPGIDEYGDRINVPVTGVDPDCGACHATGLDASDPERLIGRAMVWLNRRNLIVQAAPEWATHQKAGEGEPHDGTPIGLATALLRLVARVGGAS